MNNLVEAIAMDEMTFDDSTPRERALAARWLKQKLGTRNINYMLKNYPGMFTRLVGEIRRGVI